MFRGSRRTNLPLVAPAHEMSLFGDFSQLGMARHRSQWIPFNIHRRRVKKHTTKPYNLRYFRLCQQSIQSWNRMVQTLSRKIERSSNGTPLDSSDQFRTTLYCLSQTVTGPTTGLKKDMCHEERIHIIPRNLCGAHQSTQSLFPPSGHSGTSVEHLADRD